MGTRMGSVGARPCRLGRKGATGTACASRGQRDNRVIETTPPPFVARLGSTVRSCTEGVRHPGPPSDYRTSPLVRSKRNRLLIRIKNRLRRGCPAAHLVAVRPRLQPILAPARGPH